MQLRMCAVYAAVPIVCVSIKAGIDQHAVISEGRTASQIAHELGCTLVERLLNRAAQQAYLNRRFDYKQQMS
jgi:hypothetical protein